MQLWREYIVYVLGGASIYELLLPRIIKCLIYMCTSTLMIHLFNGIVTFDMLILFFRYSSDWCAQLNLLFSVSISKLQSNRKKINKCSYWQHHPIILIPCTEWAMLSRFHPAGVYRGAVYRAAYVSVWQQNVDSYCWRMFQFDLKKKIYTSELQ